MSDREMARAALKRGYDGCEARIVCNCDKSDCSAYLDAIATALAQARAEGLRKAAEVAGKSLTEFHHRVGERYYAGYIADMRNHVTAAIRALAEGEE